MRIKMWLFLSVLIFLKLAKGDQSCGSVVNNTLKSPGYPSDYPSDTDCVYWVPIPQYMVLKIYFNVFELEPSSTCTYDYLKIGNENNRTIGTYCGNQTGQSILVTGHYAVISFYSDGSVQYSGYELFFNHVPGCSFTLNETYGEIDFNVSSGDCLLARWNIQTAGISQAVALISVQELNLKYCSEYVKITDGKDTSILHHRGCLLFAEENLLDVEFGQSNNISLQANLESPDSSIKIKFAILKKGFSSAILVTGWNVTSSNPSTTTFILHWANLNAYNISEEKFYVIFIKNVQGIILLAEIVPGNTTAKDIMGLIPSTMYRVEVYGVDEVGQPYKRLEIVISTKEVLCGFRPSAGRIVGGSAASVNSWPWQVMLMDNSGRQFCGGSLIERYWVVTAAHCVTGEAPSDIKIRLGAHHRTEVSVGTEQDIRVSKIIIHEDYNDPLQYSNDIALIKLMTPADLGVGIGVVCMPDMKYALPFDNINKTCWITGWGTLSSGGSHPNTLMEARVPLVSKQRCQSAYPDEIDDSMLCAGLDEGGIDSCQGDSGGPLVCEFNGTWYLEGVVSWGYKCAEPGKYGVYAYVRNLKSWVSQNNYNVVQPSPSPQNQSASLLAWCSFDNGLCSGWNQSSSDDFDWTLASGRTPSSSTGPTYGQGSAGKYMYIEASSPRKPGQKAKLSVAISPNGDTSCLLFYYHMFGDSIGTLTVFSGDREVLQISGNQGNRWKRERANVFLNSSVTFEGVVGSSYTGDIAIDGVEITNGSCQVSCTFDQGLCPGWTQSELDDFDWTLHSGPTPSLSTGPSTDHGGSGYYMYIEVSPHSDGDKAKLEFLVPSSDVGKVSCLTFYYHMYGDTINSLNVYNGDSLFLNISKNQGNIWLAEKVSLTLERNITFEGIAGSSFTGDIAIDDVSITEGNCPSCSFILNKTFGEIDLNASRDDCLQPHWNIYNAGISQAVALISVKELNLQSCSEYAKIVDGSGSEILHHRGCAPFAEENLLDVQLGQSNNISVQAYLRSQRSSIKIKFAIMKKGFPTAILVSGWNVTSSNSSATTFTLQWANLNAYIISEAEFYVIFVKNVQGIILLVEIVPGNTTAKDIMGLIPSTMYRVEVYGVDEAGQPYRSSEIVISTKEVVCGFRPSAGRIVGGSAASVNSWPWQVMLMDNSDRQFCGGSLIERYWVVSAAHCVNGKSPSDIKIRLGAHHRTEVSVGTEQDIRVAKIIMHEDYNDPFQYSNDIALLKLMAPAELGAGIGVVCMPDMKYALPFDSINKTCWITGWGRLSSGGGQPNTLMEADVPLVSKQRCQSAYPGKIDDTMLCAGLDEGGIDSCQGDSGGPLVCEFNGTWYLEGVVSWGQGCAAPGKYGVYAYVRNLKSWVSQNKDNVVQPSPSPHNQSESLLVWCNFDNGLCSGWNQSSSDDFDWTLGSGSTSSSSTGPTSGQGGAGKYMYIEASSPRKPGQKAKLTVSVLPTGNDLCLSFYYHMFGDTVGTLSVYVEDYKVLYISGNQGNRWIREKRNVILNGSVTFEGIVGSSYTGDIAIDGVQIIKGNCPVSCSFDSGLCAGWNQSQSDDFDWTLQSGPTPSSSTGPLSDHSGSGHYMYIEVSPRSYGDKAKLEFSVPSAQVGKVSCLTFYYHMYGDTINTLNVYNGNAWVFRKSGNQGNVWLEAKVSLTLQRNITFEGITGSSFTGDIAIDDVTVSDEVCPGNPIMPPITTAPPNSCGSVVNNTLKSPGYPSEYPSDVDCVYQVPIPQGMTMNISLNDFDVEDDPSCSYDYLRIANDNNLTIGTFCGQRPGQSFLLGGNYAVLSFHSDGSDQRRGYDIVFSYFATTPLPPCNFDSGLCSEWQQSYSDIFDWSRHSGSTPSSDTGPSSDHAGGSGYYMYIEASSPRQAGDYADLHLFLSGSGELACLKFYYHMYGEDMGTLTVFSGNDVVFNASGNHGNYWKQATKNIYLRNSVTFKGTVGSSLTSDIGIDDVSIIGGSCAASQSSTTAGSSASVTIKPTIPAKTCGILSVVIKIPWKDAYALKFSVEYIAKRKEIVDVIESLYDDTSKYDHLEPLHLTLKEKEGYVQMSMILCLVVKSDGEFVEDIFIARVKTGSLFVMKVIKDSGEFKTLGVKFKEWKAKDGECDKCSEGGGGPFVIEGKCEADSVYSCKGVKKTKETDECVKYCNSSAVAIKISAILMAIGVLFSFSFNIWKW